MAKLKLNTRIVKSFIFYLIAFFMLTHNVLTCPSGMSKTFLYHDRLQDYGTAKDYILAGTGYPESVGGLYYRWKTNIAPRFEVFQNVVITKEIGSGWAFDGFTIILTSSNYGYVESGGYGGSIGYYGVANAIVLEADFWYNPEYNDLGSNSVSIHECLNGKCYPNENSSTSQSRLYSYSYSAYFNQSLTLHLKYENKTVYLYFNGNYMTSYKANLDYYFRNGFYIGMTSFHRSQKRTVTLQSDSYFCTAYLYDYRLTYDVDNKKIEVGKTFTMKIQLTEKNGAYFEYITLFDFRSKLKTNCPGATLSSVTAVDYITIQVQVYNCKSVGNYSITGYIKQGDSRINIQGDYTMVAAGFDVLNDYKDTDRGNCNTTTKIDGKLFLNCGENNGVYSLSDVSEEGIKIKFQASDRYGNNYSLTSTDVTKNIYVYNEANVTVSSKWAISGHEVTVIVKPVNPGDYSIYCKYLNTPHNRLYVRLESSEPDKRYVNCQFADSKQSKEIKNGEKVVYKCNLRDLNNTELKLETIKKLIKANKLSCDFLTRNTAVYTAPGYSKSNVNGYFYCETDNALTGDVVVQPYLKTKTEKILFKTKINTYTVLGLPTDFSNFYYYDNYTDEFKQPQSLNSDKLILNLSSNNLTCLDFRIQGRSVGLDGYYADFFKNEYIKGAISNIQVIEKESYKTAKLVFKTATFKNIPCISVEIDENEVSTYLRRSSFDYKISLVLNKKEFSLFYQYQLNTGGRIASAFPLKESNTKQSILLTEIFVAQEAQIAEYELHTIGDFFYNYKIDEFKIGSKLTCKVKKDEEKNTEYEFSDLFSVQYHTVDGVFYIKTKKNLIKNKCNLELKVNEVAVGKSFDITFNHLPEVQKIEIISSSNEKTVTNDDTPVVNMKLFDVYGNLFENSNTVDYSESFKLQFKIKLNDEYIDFKNNEESFIFKYNKQTKTYSLTDNVKIPGNYLIEIITLGGKTKKITYFKTPGAISGTQSSVKLASSAVMSDEGEPAVFNVTLRDKYGVLLSINKEVFDKAFNLIDLECNFAKTVTYIKINKPEIFYSEIIFESEIITVKALYEFNAYFYESEEAKTSKDKEKRNEISCDGKCSFKLKFREFDFTKTKVSILQYRLQDLYQKAVLPVNKDSFSPLLYLNFYDSDSVVVDYINIEEDQLEIKLESIDDSSKTLKLNYTIFKNTVIASVFNNQGSDSEFKSLPYGEYKLVIKYEKLNEETKKIETSTLNYILFLTGDKERETGGEISATNTAISQTVYSEIAGVEKSIIIQFRDTENKPTKKADGLVSKIKIDIGEKVDGKTSSLSTEKFKYNVTTGVQVGEYVISIIIFKKGDFLIDLKIDNSTNENDSYGLIESTISNSFLTNFLLLSPQEVSKVGDYFYTGNVVAGNSIILEFSPVDSYGNVVDEVFQEKIFSNDRIIRSFSFQKLLSTENSSEKIELENTLNLNIQVQRDFINEKFSLILTSNKTGKYSVESALMKKKYYVEVVSDSLSLDYTQSVLVIDNSYTKNNLIAGTEFTIQVELRDKYNNIISGINLPKKQLSLITIGYALENELKTKEISNFEISKSETSVNFKTRITMKGDYLIKPLYDNRGITCTNCVLSIKSNSFVWDSSVLYLNTEERQNVKFNANTANTLDKEDIPTFSLYLKDKYENTLDEISKEVFDSISFKLQKDEFSIKFCTKSTKNEIIAYFCDDSSIKMYNRAENSDKYTIRISFGEEKLKEYSVTLIGDGEDDEGSAEKIDLSKTVIENIDNTMTVGDFIRVFIEFRTEKNIRKSERIDLNLLSIKIGLANGSAISEEVKSSFDYFYDYADKPGQCFLYIFTTKSSETAGGEYKIDVVYNNFTAGHFKILALAGDAASAELIEDHSSKVVIKDEELKPSTVDSVYTLHVQLKDIYGNNSINNNFYYSLRSESEDSLVVKSQTIDLGSNILSIIILFEKAPTKYIISSELFNNSNKKYTVFIGTGMPQSANSQLISPYNAQLNESIEVEILPKDKYNNSISITKDNSKSPFLLFYKTVSKETGEYSSYEIIEQTNKTDSETTQTTYKYRLVLNQATYYTFRGTDSQYIEIPAVNSVTKVLTSDDSGFSLEKSHYYYFEKLSTSFVDLAEYKNNILFINNKNDFLKLKVIVSDASGNKNFNYDYSKFSANTEISYYSINSSTKEKKEVSGISFSITILNQSAIVEIKNEKIEEFKKLAEGEYILVIKNKSKSSDEYSLNHFLQGESIDPYKDPIDLSKTLILQRKLTVTSGTQAGFLIHLRTAKGANGNDERSTQFKLEDYDTAIAKEDEILDFKYIPTSFSGAYLFTFYCKKSNTYPPEAKFTRKLKLSAKLKSSTEMKEIENLNIEIFIEPSEINNTIMINSVTLESEEAQLYRLADITADETQIIQLKAYDVNNNQCPVDMDKLKLNIINPEMNAAEFTYTRNVMSGLQVVSINNQKVGEYNIISKGKLFKKIEEDKQPLYKKFVFKNIAGVLSIEKSVVYNSSQQLDAGKTSTLQIFLKDKYENSLKLSDFTSQILVYLIDSLGKVVKTDYNSSEDNYSQILTVSGVNKWQVIIKETLKNYPSCSISVREGDVDLTKTKLSCSNQNNEYYPCNNDDEITLTADSPLSLVFSFYDTYENLITYSIDTTLNLTFAEMKGNYMNALSLKEHTKEYTDSKSKLKVSLTEEGASEHSYLVSGENYTSTYSLMYKKQKADFTIRVKLISPFDDSEYGNGDYNISQTEIISVSNSETENNKYINQVTLKNMFKIIIRNTQGKIYNRWLEPKDYIKLTQEDLIEYTKEKTTKKGEYLITFSGVSTHINEPDEFTKIIILIKEKNGDSFIDSNRIVSFFATPFEPPEQTSDISISPVDISAVKPGVRVEITFKLYDKFNNQFKNNNLDLSRLVLLINDTITPKISSIRMNDEKDSFIATFLPEYPPLSMTANIFYKHNTSYFKLIKTDKEPQITIKPQIDTNNYLVSGTNFDEMRAGEKLDLIVQAFDTNGICYELSENESPIDVAVEGPENERYDFEIVDSDNYPVTCKRIYKINVPNNQLYTTAGSYKITVRRNGEAITKSRFQTLLPGALDEREFISTWNYEGDFSTSSIKAGRILNFTIQSKDSYNNNSIERIQDSFKVKIYDYLNNLVEENSDTITIRQEESVAGKLYYTMNLNKVGNYSFKYFYKQKELSNVNYSKGPNYITVVPANCSNSNPTINNSGLKDLIAGELIKFGIVCKDTYGNRLTSGNAGFVVRIVTKDDKNIIQDTNISNEILDKKDGTYEVSFTPMRAGNYFVSVELNKSSYGEEFKLEITNTRCKSETPIECPNNSSKCVSNLKDCLPDTDKNNCKDPKLPFYCKNEKGVLGCHKSRTECICEDENYVKCPPPVNHDVCVPKEKEYLCPFYMDLNCPSLNSSWKVLCDDGICKTSKKECSNKRVCPLGSVLCPDLSCRSDLSQCEDYPSCTDDEITCPDQTCVLDQKDCPSTITCPLASQVVCPDGECVDNEYLCKKLPNCISPHAVLCPNNTCVSNVVNCSKAVSCGHGKSLCSDMICRSSCT